MTTTEVVTMKMARASNEDIDAALTVSRILEDLDRGYMPATDEDDGLEFFDKDDAEQCRAIVGMLLDATKTTSLFRVAFGMSILLNPKNELLDPDSDVLEKHPKIAAVPELLETLRHIEGAAMDITCEHGTIRNAARAAIAKATGSKA